MKFTKEDIRKYATSKEIRILEKVENEKALESASIDSIVITRYKKKMSDGSFVYDIHIADFKTTNSPAVVMCIDERSSEETFKALNALLRKA
jgi:hypothetical protein